MIEWLPMEKFAVIVTILAMMQVIELGSAGIKVKVALVSTSRLNSNLLHHHARKYFSAVIKNLGLPQDVVLDPTPIEVHWLNDTGWRKVSKKLTPANFVAVIGSYSKSIESKVSTQKNYIPYFLVDDIFLDTKSVNPAGTLNIGPDSKHCQQRERGKFAISFLPPVNYLITPLQQYLFMEHEKTGTIFSSEKAQRFVLILQDIESFIQFRRAMKHSTKKLHLIPIFIATMLSAEDKRARLASVRKLGTKDIVLHSFKGEYIMKIMQQAESMDLLTKFYRWYITYPDIDAFYLNEEEQIKKDNFWGKNFTQTYNFTQQNHFTLNNNITRNDTIGNNATRSSPNSTNRYFQDDYLSPKLATYGANVLGFQMLDRSIFTKYKLKKPGEPRSSIQLATLLDAMIPLAEAVAGSLKSVSGGQKAITAKLVGDYMYTKFQPKYDNEGSLGRYGEFKSTLETTGQEPRSWHFCRTNVDITWKRFYLGWFGEVLRFFVRAGDDALYLRQDKTPDWRAISYAVQPNDPPKANFTGLGLFSNLPVKVSVQRDAYPLVNCSLEETRCWKEGCMRKKSKNCRGILIQIFDAITKEMGNFSYIFNDLPGHIGEFRGSDWAGHVGVFRESWGGIMGDIKRGETTFGLGGFGVTSIRLKYVQFSETILPVTISMLYKPTKPKLNMWQFLQPLSWRVWLSIFIVFITVSLTLFVQDVLDWTDASFPIRDSFYYTAGILLSGGTDAAPATIPNRVLCACFMFFCLVMFQSYTANMTAFLTTRGGLSNIASVRKLSTQSIMEYGVVSDTATEWMLKHSKKDPYLTLWNAIVSNRTNRIFLSHETALERVKQGKFVLITETPYASYYKRTNCGLTQIEDDTSILRYSLAMPLGASYLTDVNKAIRKIRAKGLDKFMNNHVTKCTKEEMSEDGTKQPLTWSEMTGIFVMLVIGVAVALMVGITGQVMQRMGIIDLHRAWRTRTRREGEEDTVDGDQLELPPTNQRS